MPCELRKLLAVFHRLVIDFDSQGNNCDLRPRRNLNAIIVTRVIRSELEPDVLGDHLARCVKVVPILHLEAPRHPLVGIWIEEFRFHLEFTQCLQRLKGLHLNIVSRKDQADGEVCIAAEYAVVAVKAPGVDAILSPYLSRFADDFKWGRGACGEPWRKNSPREGGIWSAVFLACGLDGHLQRQWRNLKVCLAQHKFVVRGTPSTHQDGVSPDGRIISGLHMEDGGLLDDRLVLPWGKIRQQIPGLGVLGTVESIQFVWTDV